MTALFRSSLDAGYVISGVVGNKPSVRDVVEKADGILTRDFGQGKIRERTLHCIMGVLL